MIKGFHLHNELELLEDFLNHVCKETEEEIAQIVELNESGEYQEMDDFFNVLYLPMSRQEIASRAILYEIASFIEHELQGVAHAPWVNSNCYAGPKTLSEIEDGNINKLKVVSRLNYDQIKTLIEEHYVIKIDDLPMAREIKEIK
jgi:hypothetical protein